MQIMANSLGITDFNVYVLAKRNLCFLPRADGNPSCSRHRHSSRPGRGAERAFPGAGRREAGPARRRGLSGPDPSDVHPPGSHADRRIGGRQRLLCLSVRRLSGRSGGGSGGRVWRKVCCPSCAGAKRSAGFSPTFCLRRQAPRLPWSARPVWPGLDADTAIIGALMVLTPGVSLTMGGPGHHQCRLSVRCHPAAGRGPGGRLPGLRRGSGVHCGVCPAGGAVMEYLFQFVVAAVSTACFGVTFQVPRRHMIACGVGGGIGWLVYLVCVAAGLSAAMATFFCGTAADAGLPAVCHQISRPGHAVSAVRNLPAGARRRHLLYRPTTFCRVPASRWPTKALRPPKSLWHWRWALR